VRGISITVGAPGELYARIERLLRYMVTDVMHVEPVEAGPFVKFVNDALSEAE
jgi:3-hydroxyisobutyrate dehydrogenase-like beta-hydroxyacid dehydrogenase